MKFSHIYIEEKALHYPLTKKILSNKKDSVQIKIRNYKDIFNRSKQDFQFQKTFPKLILAKKEENFLYEGSHLTPDFGNANFFYNSMIYNCMYNCDYCYLQGMYPSAYLVVFVNIEDCFSVVEDKLKNQKIYLSASYDTDLLAFENVVPFTSEWIEFTRKNQNLTVEIRTKSSNFRYIEKKDPTENIILAWTLSPESIIRKYEKKTPTLNKRLENVTRAISCGWNVRLCFDPVLYVKDYRIVYSEMFQTIFSEIQEAKVFDLSIGVFRMNSGYLKKIQKFRKDSDILYSPFEIVSGINSYSKEIISEMKEFLLSELCRYTSAKKTFWNCKDYSSRSSSKISIVVKPKIKSSSSAKLNPRRIPKPTPT